MLRMVNELSLGQPQLGHDSKSSQYVSPQSGHFTWFIVCIV